MSDSYMVAVRIPMTREGFERWLDTPAPAFTVIANPQEMFRDWFWNRNRAAPTWQGVGAGVTPRTFFARLVERSCTGGQLATVLLHREGALEAYVFHLGYVDTSIHTALLMFTGAGAYKTEAADDVALLWAETSGSLWDADDDGWLAVLSIGTDGARFVGECDLTGPVAGLRPAEARFFELIERLGDHEQSWDWNSGQPYRTDTPRDPSFVDPSVLA